MPTDSFNGQMNPYYNNTMMSPSYTPFAMGNAADYGTNGQTLQSLLAGGQNQSNSSPVAQLLLAGGQNQSNSSPVAQSGMMGLTPQAMSMATPNPAPQPTVIPTSPQIAGIDATNTTQPVATQSATPVAQISSGTGTAAVNTLTPEQMQQIQMFTQMGRSDLANQILQQAGMGQNPESAMQSWLSVLTGKQDPNLSDTQSLMQMLIPTTMGIGQLIARNNWLQNNGNYMTNLATSQNASQRAAVAPAPIAKA